MRSLFLLLLALPALAQEPADLQLGSVTTLESEELGETRRLNVLLPADYDSSESGYPVIYVLDGSAHEDYFHSAALLDYMPTYGMADRSIIVGISNVDRYRDFSEPSQVAEDLERLPTSGGSAAFLRFLENELLPYVQENYRCDGPSTLIGQSMGGLLAAQVLLEHPHVFDRYVIVSPSLWWNDGRLDKEAEELVQAHTASDRSVFLTVGDEHPVMVEGVERLAEVMRGCAWPGLRFEYRHLQDENHATALHISIYHAMRWFHDFDPTIGP